jgi:hypothetical protein
MHKNIESRYYEGSYRILQSNSQEVECFNMLLFAVHQTRSSRLINCLLTACSST